MRIVIGSLQQETNTLSPVITEEKDFDTAYGEDMLGRVHCTGVFHEAGAEIFPTLYAHALPGGMVKRADYERFCDDMLMRFPEGEIDGIWLYLHGAMYVEGIGSGEEYLLRRIREKAGYSVPVALALDFHANNTDALMDLANIVCGYRTAPHTDMEETEERAARLLVTCIQKKILPKPRMARCSVILPGDMVITDNEPLRGIMEEARSLEKEDGFLCANVFNGQPWVDTPYTGPSMVVIHENDTAAAEKAAEKLAAMFYSARHDFKFLIEACEPEKALEIALGSGERPLFITDSGDNTTAGAAGDNAYMLNLLLKTGAKGVLVGGIMDREAVDACYATKTGDTLRLKIGGSLDPRSESAEFTGVLRFTGRIPGWYGEDAGRAAVLKGGGITVIVTERRTALVRPEIFRAVGEDIYGYRAVIVKLGYLYPDLAAVAKRAILAFTPGGSTERLQDMGHRHIRRPMFPLDDDFM
jgi:microcystin degradation protein MlrC